MTLWEMVRLALTTIGASTVLFLLIVGAAEVGRILEAWRWRRSR